jgi:hypothetical protein
MTNQIEEISLLPGDTVMISDIRCPFEITTPDRSFRVVDAASTHHMFVVIDSTQYADLVLCQKYMSRGWWTRLRRKPS